MFDFLKRKKDKSELKPVDSKDIDHKPLEDIPLPPKPGQADITPKQEIPAPTKEPESPEPKTSEPNEPVINDEDFDFTLPDFDEENVDDLPAPPPDDGDNKNQNHDAVPGLDALDAMDQDMAQEPLIQKSDQPIETVEGETTNVKADKIVVQGNATQESGGPTVAPPQSSNSQTTQTSTPTANTTETVEVEQKVSSPVQATVKATNNKIEEPIIPQDKKPVEELPTVTAEPQSMDIEQPIVSKPAQQAQIPVSTPEQAELQEPAPAVEEEKKEVKSPEIDWADMPESPEDIQLPVGEHVEEEKHDDVKISPMTQNEPTDTKTGDQYLELDKCKLIFQSIYEVSTVIKDISNEEQHNETAKRTIISQLKIAHDDMDMMQEQLMKVDSILFER